MATYRIGIGSFSLAENGGVGIGTDSAGLGNLKVEGTLKTTDLDVTGVSTFTKYSGLVGDDINLGRTTEVSSEVGGTGDIVIGVGKSFTVSIGATVTVGTVPSVSIGTHFSPPTGGVEERPEVPVEGTVRFNRDLNTLEFYNGVEWRQVDNTTQRGRGLIMGGSNPFLSSIGFVEISTQGNEQAFGDLTQSVGIPNGNNISSSIRGLRCGGYTPSKTDTIDYVTIASQGNATDFGNQTVASEGGGGCSSSTRGLIALGNATPGHVNTIDYVEIMTVGNAVDFGDLSLGTAYNGPDAVSNGVRGVFCGGITPSYAGGTAQIQALTIASKGNTSYFGDLTGERRNMMPCSNSTRGVLMGGRNNSGGAGTSSTIDYITIASDGNAVDFGKLNTNRFRGAATSNQIRGICASGDTSSPGSNSNVIEMVTIATTGSAEDFGDVSTASDGPIGLSDSHGGLGGY